LIWRLSAITHPVTITAKVTATIHSSRESRPMLCSSLRAMAVASGVAVAPGGNSRETMRGRRRMVASAGNDAASSQVPNVIFTPDCAASDTPIGLGEVAVSHRDDATLRHV